MNLENIDFLKNPPPKIAQQYEVVTHGKSNGHTALYIQIELSKLKIDGSVKEIDIDVFIRFVQLLHNRSMCFFDTLVAEL